MRLLFILALFACSAPASPEGPVLVSYVVSPEPAIFGWTQRAVYRWNKARDCFDGSGCELVIGEGGIPVSYVDEILMPERDAKGEWMHASGASTPVPPGAPGCDWLYVHVSLETNDPERTLVHELGHVLGVEAHTATGITNGQRGLTLEQAADIQAWSINEESLLDVCSKTVCLEMNPEP